MVNKTVRQYRLVHELTQKQVSEYLNISMKAYANKESGSQEFKASELESLAKLFTVEVGDFFSTKNVLILHTSDARNE